MATDILFITGTDTGVGKTVLTALLLSSLRARGARALALKPFCSGTRADAELLHGLQEGDLSLDEVNPFYFAEPVAPLVSARRHGSHVPIEKVTQHIKATLARLRGGLPSSANLKTENSKAATQSYLLIEGSGGLLVPLGEGYTVLDLILRLRCRVLVVSRNQLGTINHSLLTLRALRRRALDGSRRRSQRGDSVSRFIKMILMDQRSPDISSRTNPRVLREWIGAVPLIQLPYLGAKIGSVGAIRANAPQVQKNLQRCWSNDRIP